jgi:hypothetical protein
MPYYAFLFATLKGRTEILDFAPSNLGKTELTVRIYTNILRHVTHTALLFRMFQDDRNLWASSSSVLKQARFIPTPPVMPFSLV